MDEESKFGNKQEINEDKKWPDTENNINQEKEEQKMENNENNKKEEEINDVAINKESNENPDFDPAIAQNEAENHNDHANTQIDDANNKIDDANNKIDDANNKIDDANNKIDDANNKIDDANKKEEEKNNNEQKKELNEEHKEEMKEEDNMANKTEDKKEGDDEEDIEEKYAEKNEAIINEESKDNNEKMWEMADMHQNKEQKKDENNLLFELEQEEEDDDEVDKDGVGKSIHDILLEISMNIRNGYFHDIDETKYILKLIKIIKKMCKKESLEEFFSNKENDLTYFMGDFLGDVIKYILIQQKIIGNNGEEIAMELLSQIFNLFVKFHNNPKYAPMFENINTIFAKASENPFFNKSRNADNNQMNYAQFNEIYNSEFKIEEENKNFKIGDLVDFATENPRKRLYDLDNYCWVRGRIKDISDNKYIIEYCEEKDVEIPFGEHNIYPVGTKTKDYDWRLNLKQYDLVDAFDRNRWYPGVIAAIEKKTEINGFTNIIYQVGFRVYPDNFKNEDDPSDTYEKHLDIWNQHSSVTHGSDSMGEYYGDQSNYDEKIPFYSKKIQKFNTFSKCQQQNLDYSESYHSQQLNNKHNSMQKMNEKLSNDTSYIIDNYFRYIANGKKNIIIGKPINFFEYFGLFLKKLEKKQYFTKFIEILQDKPNAQSIFTIFYFYLSCFDYIHKDYFKENNDLIKNSLLSFINGLTDKDMKNIPKNLMDIISQLLSKLNLYSESNKNDNFMALYNEITFTMSLKAIKSSIFDSRLQGIKQLNEYIETNKQNEESCKKIIELLKKNQIIQDIFGPNYHSQIINKSVEIVKLLLAKNELTEDEITLIWSCTKRGDLEAKITIMKLLSDLSSSLKEEYIEMILKSILEHIDNKISTEEIDLVYKLSLEGQNNIKNILICCDYLCKCLLNSETTQVKGNPIMDKILAIIRLDDSFLERILNICINCLKKNEKALLSFSILYEIMDNIIIQNSKPLLNLQKDYYLLKLFEYNFKLYINQAKDLMIKNNISDKDPQNIDKLIVDGFPHLENIKKRMQIFSNLIKFYPDNDFLPFLKEVLITDSVCPNDKLEFFEFIKNYISEIEESNDVANLNPQKEKVKKELFQIISDDSKGDFHEEQLKLFIAMFFNMNSDKIRMKDKEVGDKNYEVEILNLNKVEELKGIDKFWSMIFKIVDDETLSSAINILFQLYNHNELDNLLNILENYISNENSTPEIINKCITILKQIIIISEKDAYCKIKSHLSLLKECLINLPLKFDNRGINVNENKKYILTGNTTLNELKIITSKEHDINPISVQLSLSENYLNKIKELKNIDNENLFSNETISQDKNNITLNEILLTKEKLITEILPKEKILFTQTELKRAALIINDEMNPKFKKILQEWFQLFTNGTGKMGPKEVMKFIKGVMGKVITDEKDSTVTEFLEQNAKKEKGYVNEEEFINFYFEKSSEREGAVWSNLFKMGVRKDLTKKGEEYKVAELDKIYSPRYKLGNNLNLIRKLTEIYYNNPNEYNSIADLLLYLTTNENIYDEVLNMFDDRNKDSFVNKVLNDENKYVEHNYIFIIIQSIFQDLELNSFVHKSNDGNSIKIGPVKYEFRNIKYEPFDKQENYEKKINFIKNLAKAENLKKIVKIVNNLLIKLNNETNESGEISSKAILYNCCLRGFQIINMINNAKNGVGKDSINYFVEFTKNHIYKLGYNNISSLLRDSNLKKDITIFPYEDSIDNFIGYLNKNKSNNCDILYKNCLYLFIDIISSKNDLLEKYIPQDQENEEFNNLFIYNLSDFQFIQKLDQSLGKAILFNNKDYLKFLYQLLNSLLNNMLNFDDNKNKPEDNEDKYSFINNSFFFDFYNNLNSTIANNDSDEFKDKAASGTSFTDKIYSLLMKELSNNKNKNEKKLLNLFKLFSLSTNNNNLKTEILFKKNGESETLFDLILKTYLNRNNKKEKKINEINTDDNEYQLLNKKEEKDDDSKFICLENVHEEKKKKDTSSEDFNTLLKGFLLDSFKEYGNSKIFKKIIKIVNFFNATKSKSAFSNDDTSDEDNNLISSHSLHHQNSFSSKKQHGHVGLKNLGCICYMNSIMQQIYMVPTFRRAIMQADDGQEPSPSSNFITQFDDDNLLHQLQEMYTYLTYSDKMDYNPRGFCNSYKDFDGKPINIGAQQDSQEFCNGFCDKIEENLKKTKFKYIVSDVFTGKTCSSVICDECKHISNRFEDFYNLTLEVKNINNLNDSLQKLIVPEIIDDFKCSNCNKNVRIKKITSINKLPNVLIVHLKRFYLDYETCNTTKINSRFEFPKNINLKPFCVEEITKNLNSSQDENYDIYTKEDDYYQYELKGINVHTGSASGGHYFSFINVNREGKDNIMFENNDKNKENWLQFNDSRVSEFDTKTIPDECFGGNTGPYNFENCQNAYLLIYERKKKNPIRVIMDENEVKNKDKIVKFDKDNRAKISKEYDLSRAGNNLKEEELYKIIFNDKEKDEYYKYVPYYNLKKYAPKKAYLECIKENNQSPSEEKDNKNNTKDGKLFKKILLEKLYDNNFVFNQNEYDDNYLEIIISTIIKNYEKKIKSNNTLDTEEKKKFNEEVHIMLNKFINPLIHTDTNLSIIKMINKVLYERVYLEKLFTSEENGGSYNLTNENAELYTNILFNIMNLCYKKGENYKNYKQEYKSSINEISNFINYRNSPSNSNDEQEDSSANSLLYMFKFVYKIICSFEKVKKEFVEDRVIYYTMNKISNEKKENRKILYNIIIALLKSSKYYSKDLFRLKEGEEEGKYEIGLKEHIPNHLNKSMVKLLFGEKIELLNMFGIIFSYDSKEFTRKYSEYLTYLMKVYFGKKREDELLSIIFDWFNIQDSCTLIRYILLFGYPTHIVKEIPIEINIKPNYIDDSSSDEEKEDKKKINEEEKNEEKKDKQKWPIFGERLINGDINEEIYKYISINLIGNNNLLRMLFPSKDDIQEENQQKEKEKENEEKESSFGNHYITSSNTKSKRINISPETQKKILLKLYNSFFNSVNPYPLFKYIYLMPSRTLKYKNLYEEMKELLKNEVNLDKNKQKEEEYINRIEVDIQESIKKMKELENKYDNEEEEADSDDDRDLYSQFHHQEKKKGKKFSCSIDNFIGFNTEIIPGEIIFEKIKKSSSQYHNYHIYRVEYITKYYKVEELRNKLLNKNINEIKEEEKKDDKNEIKEENKDGEEGGKKEEEEDNDYEVYDISNINEMEYICSKASNNIIIKDKNIKDKKNCRCTLVRYLYFNDDNSNNDINVEIYKKDSMNYLSDINCFLSPMEVKNSLSNKNVLCIFSIYGIKEDLPFLNENDIKLSISF